jgi:diguanylate cyclase (GGDEF)-like protein/PAS domain S-box-containing protein
MTQQGVEHASPHPSVLHWLTQLRIPAFALDLQGRVVGWNEALVTLTGVAQAAMLGRTDAWAAFSAEPQMLTAQSLLLHVEQAQRLEQIVPESMHEAGQYRLPHNRRKCLLLNDATLLRDEQGVPCGILQLIQDRSEQEKAATRFRRLFTASPDPVWIIENNTFVDCNDAAVSMLGYDSRETLLNTHPSKLSPEYQPDGASSFEKAERMMALALQNGLHRFEWVHTRADGTDFDAEVTLARLEIGGNHTIYCSWRDITERKQAAQRIDWLAHHDVLTGLLNRHGLTQQLNQALTNAQRNQRHLALVFMDLDRFKTINDTMGHQVGDQLLAEVARRLRTQLRESDIIARLGGDEFVMVLTNLVAPTQCMPVLSKLEARLNEPYPVENRLLYLTPSMGVALYPHDGVSGDELMRQADTAMYHAKDNGRNNTQYYAAEMGRRAATRLALERELWSALEHSHFELFYQPLVEAGSGSICGAEALVRWQHPERGMISPADFIPVAEECGAILKLGAWVLDEACRQMQVWQDSGMAPIRVAVNISAHQLAQHDFVSWVNDCLSRHRLSPTRLTLEVTESVAMERPENAIAVLNALGRMGVDLAIDDFGTGHSSLAYLQSLPIQHLKLDRRFVTNMCQNESDAAIVAASIALAHKLGLSVVAEGVETADQRDALLAQGCDMLQGYFFGRPQPASHWSELLQTVSG